MRGAGVKSTYGVERVDQREVESREPVRASEMVRVAGGAGERGSGTCGVESGSGVGR